MQLSQRLGRCEFPDANSTLSTWDGCRGCEHYPDYDDIRGRANCPPGTMIGDTFYCANDSRRYRVHQDRITTITPACCAVVFIICWTLAVITRHSDRWSLLIPFDSKTRSSMKVSTHGVLLYLSLVGILLIR